MEFKGGGNRAKLQVLSKKFMGINGPSNNPLPVDHEIISPVILLPSTESFKKGCCQLQAKVCARSTG